MLKAACLEIEEKSKMIICAKCLTPFYRVQDGPGWLLQ